MKPNLYICHTAYQVLVDLLRAGRCAGKPHTMVLSASVPDTAALAVRLDATGVVKTVLVDETRWPGTVTGLFAHRRAARAFEKLCGWKLNCAAFENVYIHNDWSVLGRYLQDCRAGYILCEDTFGSTLGPDQHLVTDQRAGGSRPCRGHPGPAQRPQIRQRGGGFCREAARKRLPVLGRQPVVRPRRE